MEKLNFTQAIRQQMLDGDTFELIDGRNLEMKGDIIRQILGDEIECAKCIVACVIGPQSTGKSTLMNFTFGTQFLASTGRCTQGIYFTLQRIPPELKQGKDVEYLIILDTEGLNSPERAEPEYDRKIVIFTLLCSDFLIINSRGDMSYQMKELIKICAVRYDQLRGNAKVPKILYTFVQNSETNTSNFLAQISSLKSDVIECSTTQTIKKTTDELMTVHDNLVKVMGSAYVQQLIEEDESKGLFESNNINTCVPIFGVHSSEVWIEVQKLFLQSNYQFRQIGIWLTQAQDHWSLIERHGAKLVEHQNVTAMKNDTKMQGFFGKLWYEYLATKITAKDNQKAKENSKIIFDSFLQGNDLNEEKNKFIKANNEEKSKDYDQIWYKFEKWKLEPSQQSLTQDLETKQKLELKKKMDVLKDSFKLLLENKLKETQMMQIRNNGISEIFHKARLLGLTLKLEKSDDYKEKLINEAFEKDWDQIMTELSGKKQIEKLRQTNCEYLSSTFMNVNSFMNIIKPHEYNQIVKAANSEDFQQDQDLPKQLVTYLVDHISENAFKDNKGQIDPKDQFKYNPQMLGMLKDPSERIFCEKEKDKYLPLQKLLKVNYKYEILSDMVFSLSNSSIYEQIKHELNQVKLIETQHFNWNIFQQQIFYSKITKVDDNEKIVNSISTIFQELGQAGYGFEQQVENAKNKSDKTNKMFILLSQINVEEELNNYSVFNDSKKKENWLKDLKKRITWKQSENINISQRIQPILKFSAAHFRNQMDPKVKFEDHLASSQIIQKAMWSNNKPELSYVFSNDSAGGKINVEKFLCDRKQSSMKDCYFQCLVNPVKYEISEAQKWTNLSKLTSMLIDWKKIVFTINEKVSTEIIKVEQKSNSDLQQTNKNQIDTEFDLKNVIERNQITLEQAERIQLNQLQGIKQDLDDELNSKLALSVHQTLYGVITWVACVIIWYKSQKNILTKFNEQSKKFESQKNTFKQNFRDIALGEAATVTIQGARQIFNDPFKIFNESLKNQIIENINNALVNNDTLIKFDVDRVYIEMDRQYISSATSDDYKKFISYVQDPVKLFESYVNNLSLVFVEKLETVQMNLYKNWVNANLSNLKKRLELVKSIIQKNKRWVESVNLFEILKVGETVPLMYQEKKKIESEFSHVYLITLRSILEGTYKIGSQEVTLKVNGVETKFIFTAKGKDPSQKEIGSPLQELQSLQFEQDEEDEFFESFLMRLDLSEKNFGLCSDLKIMIENLILAIDSKISETENLTLNDICDINQQVKSLQNNAIGCRVLCKFCNRKCEHKPHKEEEILHSCQKRGHQLRVFGGGSLDTSWGVKYPSLYTCDEIDPSTHIRITNDKGTEIRIWSEIHEAINRNWITDYIKFKDDQINPVWSQMHDKLGDFWKVLGKRYCQENKYKYIQADESPQFSKIQISNTNEKCIVILCLDDSGSMFNSQNDFQQAVDGGKEVEQYLKNNHQNQSEVHVQLWYNDCCGVTQAYKGLLKDEIPAKAWVRYGCQSDGEIKKKKPAAVYGGCGQFEGAVRILHKEVENLLENDSSYKRVYWYMFTDGGNSYPEKELEQLNKTFKANPEKWTDSTGARSKLVPLIITNQIQVESLVKISNKLNQISNEIWGDEHFCSLKQNVKTEKIAETMIERFILN